MSNNDDDFLWSGTGTPDADIAAMQRDLAPLAHQAPLDEVRLARERRDQPISAQQARNARPSTGRQSPVLLAAGICSAGLCVAALLLLMKGGKKNPCTETAPGFAFASSSDVSCGSHASLQGNLPVGETITVGRTSMELTIANIGKAQIAPGSEITLVTTSVREHRLALRHGRMHATVVAPPRLFVVEMAATTAIDLGCEYDVTVNRAGVGELTVLSGSVELTSKFGAVVVPAGYTAKLAPSLGTGVPLITASTGYLVTIAADVAAGVPIAPERWHTPTMDDALTLAYLLPRLDAAARTIVVDQLIQLVPLPEIDTGAAKAGNLAAIERWCDALVQQLGAVPSDGGKGGYNDQGKGQGKAIPSKMPTPPPGQAATPAPAIQP